MRNFKFFQKEKEQTRAREVFQRRRELDLQRQQRQNGVVDQEQVVTYFQQRQNEWWQEPDVVQSMEEDNRLTQERIEFLVQRINTLYDEISDYERELNILSE
jgi:hypothetical protein